MINRSNAFSSRGLGSHPGDLEWLHRGCQRTGL